MHDSPREVERPGVARRQLAQELKRLREGLGLSTREVAVGLGLSQSKVTRAENVTHRVEARTVASMCAFYGVDQDVSAELCALAVADTGEGAWLVRAGGTRRRQRQGATLEQVALRIRQYQPMLVPGIFQTPGYVRGVLAALGEPTDPEVVIAGRCARQEAVLGSTGPVYEVILTEQAITARYAPAPALAAQLEQLAGLGEGPRLSVRVIPGDATRTAMSMVPFVHFTFRDAPATVYVETPTADLYVAAPEDVARYMAMFERLSNDALDAQASRALLTDLAEEYRCATWPAVPLS
jgi:Domain of unknown function (DUF5753)/Helix-turn-helix domain